MKTGGVGDAGSLSAAGIRSGVSLGAVAFVERGNAATGRDLEEALIAAGGCVVQSLERQVIGWFGSAVSCVRWGSMLAASGVRAGLSVGDVLIENDLLHGIPVVEASRLKDLAAPGQVLCTGRLARLAGVSPEGVNDLGKLSLKGIDRLVSVVELR